MASAVAMVVKRIMELLIQEERFLSGVSTEVEQLNVELKRMDCFLEDADSKLQRSSGGDRSIRNWIAEIRDLAFQAENVLELFVAQVESKRRPGFRSKINRFSTIFSEAKTCHKVGTEIKNINSKIDNLTRSLQTYGIRFISEGERSETTQRWLRQEYPHMTAEHFVGMEQDVNQVLSSLLDEGQQCKVVSLLGMGGIGKTTLAKKIYNHDDVRRHFEALAWVCITQQCQPREVLQDVLRELLPSKTCIEMSHLTDRELVRELYKVQQKMKCLVVLDDIWTMEAWNILCDAFPIKDRAGNSKILLTTRSKSVAEQGYLHKISCLTEDEGWELLKMKAFPVTDYPTDYNVNVNTEKFGREMVQKCGGLPLAISVLGGILKKKSSSREWEMVNKDISSYLTGKGCINDEQAVKALKDVLSLSFNMLPYRLKPCFLYLGHFLEDVSIQVEHLCLLWVAEGMIFSEDRMNGETLMEVAERYLGELADRSMVQVSLVSNSFEWSTTKELRSCRLHDLMLDLCLLKCKEEDFLRVHDFQSYASTETAVHPDTTTSEINTKAHRLAVYVNKDSSDTHVLPTLAPEVTRHIKSLLFHGFFSLRKKSNWPLNVSTLRRFAFLRVLDLRSINFGERKFPKELEELIHLRYLSLNYCYLLELPSSISNLRYLQILDLRIVGNECVIPNVLLKMKNLRHLYLPSVFRTKKGQKLRLHDLSGLETLKNFHSYLCDTEDLKKLTNLRYLSANIVINHKEVATVISYLNTTAHLIQKSHIELRKIDFRSDKELCCLGEVFKCCSLEYLNIIGHIQKLPQYKGADSYSTNLTNVSLFYSKMEEDPFVTLEKLPSLQVLTIGYESYVGKQMACSSSGFPQLIKLNLWKLPNLEEWSVGEGAMPNLSVLDILGCHKLKMLPDGIKFITSLRSLMIVNMPPAFTRRLEVVTGKGGEDLHKVRQATIGYWE